MSDCGCSVETVGTPEEASVLRIALALNATMFLVGMVAGVLADSASLIADSLDMLADAAAYMIALLAISRTPRFKASAGRASGLILMLLGVGVIADAIRRLAVGSEPDSLAMMAVAALSMTVNLFVLRMLDRFRKGEVHLRATWLFTRVDVIVNFAVIASGAIIWLTGWRWPDLFIALAIGAYVIKEGLEIQREAREAREGVLLAVVVSTAPCQKDEP